MEISDSLGYAVHYLVTFQNNTQLGIHWFTQGAVIMLAEKTQLAVQGNCGCI